MKRFIGILIIIIILAGLSVGEELLVNSTTKMLHNASYNLEKIAIENKDNIDCDLMHKEFKKLDNFWDEKEKVLCYIVNFEKIKPINETLHKLGSAINENDYSVAMENIETLQNYSENMHYVMGASLTNFI